MNRTALLQQWRDRFSEPTSGWDFNEVDGSMQTYEPPWSYDDLARSTLVGAGSALDMGTGGGKVLIGLRDALPPDTVATEGWPPNLPVATSALAPHDIEVVAYDAESDVGMPFADGRFDVVLNRHEAYVATEVWRVLVPGGRFLTQQVDGRNFSETQILFGGDTAYPHITLDHLRAEAEAAGFVVDDARDWTGLRRFADVGTLVSYLRMVPWEVPANFSVDRYADVLLDLHASARDLVFTQRRFALGCRRPT